MYTSFHSVWQIDSGLEWFVIDNDIRHQSGPQHFDNKYRFLQEYRSR